MNIDHIIETLNQHAVKYLLIGGVHFLLRHKPQLTFDVDVWVDDKPDNLLHCEKALISLKAEWGSTDQNWGPVSGKNPGWLGSQSVFCLTSPFGAIDIFLSVAGLKSWAECNKHAVAGKTASGVPYRGISDEDLLQSQYALDKKDQHPERISTLESILKDKSRKK